MYYFVRFSFVQCNTACEAITV